MDILFLNQYYPPDVAPTGRAAHGLACSLLQRGHSVRVVCSRRSYGGRRGFAAREVLDGVGIRRVPAFGFGRRTLAGKLLDFASFFVSALPALLSTRPRPDMILAMTTPPHIGLLAAWTARLRGCRHCHWVMDVYPDAVVAHGMAHRGILERVSAWELQGSALTLTLNEDMAERVQHYAGGGTVHWVPLWPPDNITAELQEECMSADALRRARGWREDETVVMYSGNMGLGHRFDEFMAAARLTADNRTVRWVFAGGGKRRAQVADFARKHRGLRLELLPYAAPEKLRAHLLSADVHLASMNTNWRGCIAPSKLQAVFAVGRPLIFVGPTDDAMARHVLDSGGGWVVAEGDVDGLVAAVRESVDVTERRKRGEAARRYAAMHFDRDRNTARICELLEGAVQAG